MDPKICLTQMFCMSKIIWRSKNNCCPIFLPFRSVGVIYNQKSYLPDIFLPFQAFWSNFDFFMSNLIFFPPNFFGGEGTFKNSPNHSRPMFLPLRLIWNNFDFFHFVPNLVPAHIYSGGRAGLRQHFCNFWRVHSLS